MTPTEQFLQARDFLIENRADYETAYRNFALPKFTEFNWALDFFDVIAKDNNKIGLKLIAEDDSEEQISFSDLSIKSNQVANFFNSIGLKPGERVLMALENQKENWLTILAAMKFGMVIIPVSTLSSPEEIVDRVNRGKVKMVITNITKTEKFERIADNIIKVAVGGERTGWLQYEDFTNESVSFKTKKKTLSSDQLFVYFTSGTTSRPKLVSHSHTSYPVGHLSTMYWIGLEADDTHLNISASGWAKSMWSSFFAPWNAEATILSYRFERFDAKRILNLIYKHKVTSLCAPPTVWRMFLQEKLEDYKIHLKKLVSAGEPLNPEIIEKIQSAWDLTIRDGYGQTETSAQIGNTPAQSLKPGSMGRPLPGYKVILRDDNGDPGDEGEISLDISTDPVGMMLGYDSDQELTAEAFRDGIYRTGDIATRDEEGYLTFVGRKDDVFKSSGYRLSPFELENIVIEHNAVAEVAVVPSPDDLRLFVPKAFITLKAGISPDSKIAFDILSYCNARLAPYKRIRRIEFHDLPKTLSGKIRRAELRELESGRDPGARRELEFREEDLSI